jgi:hypothetical protein
MEDAVKLELELENYEETPLYKLKKFHERCKEVDTDNLLETFKIVFSRRNKLP